MNSLYGLDAAVLAAAFFVLLVLGLLGLLLAFSFSLSSARYDARKAVLLKEINAIGTAWLRADFLEPGAQQQLKTLIRRYVGLRVA